MKYMTRVAFILVIGCWGAFLTPGCAPSAKSPIHPAISKLEHARRSVCVFHNLDTKSSGTAFMVGRTKVEMGYKYRGLTNFHVINDLTKAIATGGIASLPDIKLTFQPTFHGEPLRVTIRLEDIDWTDPNSDWASFIFVMEPYVECVELATREEFIQLKAFEEVYLIGAGASWIPHCRVASMGMTHNQYHDLAIQQKPSHGPWNLHPNRFFRPDVSIWYGDSGGPIINKDGKVIGMITAFGFNNMGIVVTHAGVALKTHLIRDIVSSSKDFFKVEENK